MKFIIKFLLLSLVCSLVWAGGSVNINKASAEQIAEALSGIGLSKAEKIVEYREANGSFSHVDELVNVKGIGVRTIDRNRGQILLEDTADSNTN